MRKLVLQSDFGLCDGAVSAMKGIAYGVNGDLVISDVTHDITPFNVWEASYRLFQVFDFWPEGTVFVSVVDPGVGSDRKSVVAKLVDDKYVVSPDNGTLTHLYLHNQILELREIDEAVNRLKGSEGSHTFHGRDVYSYTGARLACGAINYGGVGKELPLDSIIRIEKNKVQFENNLLTGTIEVLDKRFGHLWSDISVKNLESLNVVYGEKINVIISHDKKVFFNDLVPFCRSFSNVEPGDRLAYVNSMMSLAVAIHQDSFSRTYNIEAGSDWKIEISRTRGE